MSSLVLSDEQTELVTQFAEPIPVVDARGRRIGLFTPEATVSLSPEELDKVLARLARKDQVWRTTEEVIERLKARSAK